MPLPELKITSMKPGGTPDLGQPVGVDQVGLVPGRVTGVEQRVDVRRADEDVQVLGGAVDAGLVHEGERPADEERDPRAGQDVHRLPVKRARRGFDHAWVGDSPIRRSAKWNPSYSRPVMGVVAGITAGRAARGLIRAPMPKSPGVVRIAAFGDIHLGRAAYGPPVQTILTDVAERADILVLCGDLTDRGEPEEGRQVAKALAGLGLPIVAVLGNHDYESGRRRSSSASCASRGSRCSTATPSRCTGWDSPGSRDSPAGSGAGPSAPGARRSSSCSCGKRWTKRSSWRPR